MWWIVGIVAVWLVLGALFAWWMGRAITHADEQESAVELRRRDKFESQHADDGN